MKNSQRGQVMLITTLVLSGVVLASITVAGVLMLYQIRQAGNAAQSAKAIYAADTGINYRLYQLLQNDCNHPAPEFVDATQSESAISLETATNPADPKDVVINSNGTAGKTFRSFILNIGAYTDTIPCQQ